MSEFKPNVYPIMYWGLFYGLLAGFLLFFLLLLSRYLTFIWFPVFLAGLVWGGYRNYQKQKVEFGKAEGQPSQPKPIMEELKEAASDITVATREILNQQGTQETKKEESPKIDEPNRPDQPPSM